MDIPAAGHVILVMLNGESVDHQPGILNIYKFNIVRFQAYLYIAEETKL